jgi:hypothetical protein
MSSRPEFASFRGSANSEQFSSQFKTQPNPRRSASTPFSSESIDDQIRWFFENAPEGEPLPRDVSAPIADPKCCG